MGAIIQKTPLNFIIGGRVLQFGMRDWLGLVAAVIPSLPFFLGVTFVRHGFP